MHSNFEDLFSVAPVPTREKGKRKVYMRKKVVKETFFQVEESGEGVAIWFHLISC